MVSILKLDIFPAYLINYKVLSSSFFTRQKTPIPNLANTPISLVNNTSALQD